MREYSPRKVALMLGVAASRAPRGPRNIAMDIGLAIELDAMGAWLVANDRRQDARDVRAALATVVADVEASLEELADAVRGLNEAEWKSKVDEPEEG